MLCIFGASGGGCWRLSVRLALVDLEAVNLFVTKLLRLFKSDARYWGLGVGGKGGNLFLNGSW